MITLSIIDKLFTLQNISLLFVLLFIVLVVLRLTEKFQKPKKHSKSRITILANNGKKYVIKNANLGVFIAGASGAGKSAGPFLQLAMHFAKEKFAGIINDFKDYELTDITYPLFRNAGMNFYVFALHDVNRSLRINPISPQYISTDTDIINIVSVLIQNISSDSGGGDSFFEDAAKSLLAGLVSRLNQTHPEDCNIPTIIAIILGNANLGDILTDEEREKALQQGDTFVLSPYGRLGRYLNSDIHSATLASPFLKGLANEKQTAAVMSTVATYLSKLISPELFYLLTGNDIDLNINRDDNRAVISFVNNPKQSQAISPILATMIEVCMNQMAARGRDASFILLDEAPTVRLMGLGEKTRTLRSFGVHFIYGIQDKVAGIAQFGGKTYRYKEITANLSTQFFGKVNDPETAQDYEKYFELIKVSNKSISKGGGGGERTTISKQEKHKFRAHEFFTFQAGEFVMFSGGEAHRFRFKYYADAEQERPPVIRSVTKTELEEHFKKVFDRANEIISSFPSPLNN